MRAQEKEMLRLDKFSDSRTKVFIQGARIKEMKLSKML